MAEWREVIGFLAYQVSDAGRVRRIVSRGGNPCCRESVQHADPNGYLSVYLYKDSICSHRQVNRLVCEAFNGPPPTHEHEAAHWDGNKRKNTPKNLRWATPLENAADRDRLGKTATRQNGKSGTAKLTEQNIRVIRFLFLPRPRSNSAALSRNRKDHS